jgi:hypothetical protein
VLRRGVATGELRPDTDIEVAMLALMGAVLARGGKRDDSQARPGFAIRVVDELLRGFAPHGQPEPLAAELSPPLKI